MMKGYTRLMTVVLICVAGLVLSMISKLVPDRAEAVPVAHAVQPSFTQAIGSPFKVGSSAGAPIIADLNADGRPDILATYGDENQGGFVAVLADEKGGYRVGEPMSVGLGGVKVAVGDIDSDGIPDVALGAHDSQTIRLYLGDGRGGFREVPEKRVVFKENGRPHTHSLALRDVDGDGKPDLLIGSADENCVYVLLGRGNARFQPSTGSPFAAGNHPYEGLSVADFDGNGHLDIAIPNMHGRAVSVLLGDGKGAFRAAPGSPFAVESRPGSVAAGDLNGDGKPEIVATHDDDPLVAILVNGGAGRFNRAEGSPLRLSDQVWGVEIADIDRDGYQDLVLAARGGRALVLQGDGKAGFTRAPLRVPTGGRGSGNVAVADLNGDGKPDLVTANFESGDISVLIQN